MVSFSRKAPERSNFQSQIRNGWARTIVAICIVVAAMVFQDTILTSAYRHMRGWLGIPTPPPNTLVCSAYSLLMVFRLTWWLVVAALIAFTDPPGITSVLRIDQRQVIYFWRGLAVGFAVMAATVLAIVFVGDGRVHLSDGTAVQHAAYGIAWFLAEVVGAAGEEILYRGLLLMLVTRLLGIRAGMAISALAFMAGHGANPGASVVWLVRLALAGLLLAYSVFRSGAVWWATGYHAGWNFASAPLFGAVGSGYFDRGTFFIFHPAGTALITGGPVGPEGSVFAFVAVVIATWLLIRTVPAGCQALSWRATRDVGNGS
jgi:membrane protease YdiL (CAAX protease family)